ncbi:hypothetical protein PMAYCL1PPCAC_32298, partial [Pristionchus mayeri]
MRSVNGTLFFTYAGPCTHLGTSFCHRSVFLQAALISHSTVLLFLSYCYRLWMIGRSPLKNFGQPRKRTIALLAVAAFVPSAPLFASFFKFLNDAAATYDGCLESAKCSNLRLCPVSSSNWLAPLAFGILFFTYFIEFTAVVVVRYILLRRISRIHTQDRAGHQMIFKSLTAQLLLPLSSIIGCFAFAIDFLEIIQSTWLQRSVILIGSFLALGAPLTNLYFLRPYRK